MFTDFGSPETVVESLMAPGFPAPSHPAEPDVFCRQAAMPGHDQQRIDRAHVVVVGCGGLGSWIALGLARLGVSELTLIDPDRFDRTNAPRQLMFARDLQRFKAHALAHHVAEHMTSTGRINGLALSFEEALPTISEQVDLVVIGVDNNAVRLSASSWATFSSIPAIFTMLSLDGLRAQAFLQQPSGACLSCALPNLDAETMAPCAAASIASCMLAGSHALALSVAVLSGNTTIPAWRETSLDGSTERTGAPPRRLACPNCARRA